MLIAGVDEVGRGPLAGPVVAAAVILYPDIIIDGIADSKKLSEKKREKLMLQIQEKAYAWSVARVEPKEIDSINIHNASLLAMQRAVMTLSIIPNRVLVDGKYCPKLHLPVEAIVKGDETVPAISAASIIAKVIRDNEMKQMEQQYPGYGFAQHKGYPTKMHLNALSELGITDIHRRSYQPVRVLLGESV